MAAYDILTAAEVKAYMGVSGSASDTIIGTFISDTSLWIEQHCDRKFTGSQAVSSEIGNGDGSDRFYPKYAPVQTVTVFQKRGSPTDSWADICTDSDNILIDPVDGAYIEAYGTVVPAGRSNIKVTYTAGYSTVPAAVKQVAYEMVAHRLRQSNDPALGMNRLGKASDSSSNTGGGTDSASYDDMLPKWREQLRPYKKVRRQAALVR